MGARLVIFLLIVAGSWVSWLLALPAIAIIAFLYSRINYPLLRLRSAQGWWVLLDIGVPAVSVLIVRMILAI
jgi:hypothetical protein